MKQIDGTCVLALVLRQELHARDERRDADASTDPDLAGTPVVESEAAVRPLDRHPVANLQAFRQPAGVVAQRLGDEGDAPVFRHPG